MFGNNSNELYLVYFEFNGICDSYNKDSGLEISSYDCPKYLNQKNNLQKIIDYVNEKKWKIYDLSKDKDSSNESQTIKEIKKDKENRILFITNNKKLFTNFNRPTYLYNLDNKSLDVNNRELITVNINEIISFLKSNQIFEIKQRINIFLSTYRNIFEFDIKLLIKDTAYEVKEENALIELINEDLDLYIFKRVLTSRLSIILYRLFFFDLNAKKTAVGRFFKEHLNVKSETYSFKNLNNNQEGFYFTSLDDKPFRGYKIPFFTISKPDDLFVEKIKIAKKLLKLKVKMKTVSEALEIDEDELNKIIYENNNTIINTFTREYNRALVEPDGSLKKLKDPGFGIIK